MSEMEMESIVENESAEKQNDENVDNNDLALIKIRADMFRNFISSSISENINLYITKEKLSIVNIDESNVLMSVSTLSNKECQIFKVKENFSVSLSISDLLKLMPKDKKLKEMVLTLQINKSAFNMNYSFNGMSNNYKVRVSAINDTPLKEPTLSPLAIISLEAKFIKDIIKRFNNDLLLINVYADNVVLSSGSFNDEGSLSIRETYNRTCESVKKIFLEGKDKQEIRINTQFLKKALNSASKETIIQFSIATREPLKITYLINSQDTLVYWIAPYIDSE
jgi:hypothetical protein